MGIKLTGVLIFAVLFMDPCAQTPRRVELKDVPEACGSETSQMYVRLSGRLHNTAEINCGDRPGGRRCDVWLADANGENQVKAAIRATATRNEQVRGGSFILVPEAPADAAAPFTVRFEDILIYDRVGNLRDHMKETIDLSGPLELDRNTQICSLRVLHIESNAVEN